MHAKSFYNVERQRCSGDKCVAHGWNTGAIDRRIRRMQTKVIYCCRTQYITSRSSSPKHTHSPLCHFMSVKRSLLSTFFLLLLSFVSFDENKSLEWNSNIYLFMHSFVLVWSRRRDGDDGRQCGGHIHATPHFVSILAHTHTRTAHPHARIEHTEKLVNFTRASTTLCSFTRHKNVCCFSHANFVSFRFVLDFTQRTHKHNCSFSDDNESELRQ